MSQPTCNQLPTTTQQMRPAPLPAFLFLLTPLRSILMANPPSLLCQELCSPNSHFPSSSPAPSHKPVCAWQREASVHLSADRFTGRSCTGQSGLVFFFLTVGSTGLQALLHSTFKMLGAILLFIPTTEQPTARACCCATWSWALCTLLLASWYPRKTPQSQPQHVLSLRPANH